MKMIRKLILMLFFCLLNTAQAKIIPGSLDTGRLAVGISFSSYSGDDWVLLASYIYPAYFLDLGVSHERTNPVSGSSFNLTELRSHLGKRYALSDQIFFDYGILGSYGFRSEETSNRVDPYEVGFFSGLSTYMNQNLIIAMKISPYSYERSYNTQTNNRFFSEGSVSMSYLF